MLFTHHGGHPTFLLGKCADAMSRLLWLLVLARFTIHGFIIPKSRNGRKNDSLSAATKALPDNGAAKPSRKRKPSQSSSTIWRVFGINVHPDALVEDDDDTSLHPAVAAALRKRLGNATDIQHTEIVRRSLDARNKQKTPKYVYTIDVTVGSTARPLRQVPGRLERMEPIAQQPATINSSSSSPKTVVIVGAGPAGLFCALQLAETHDIRPIVLERGQPVERRGRDIGGLMHRKILNAESNFAFGEGGAGTWSDGKLTTRIGRNAQNVRRVLETFVRYGAPERILVDGAPHLGTDALVRLLRNLREDLQRMGGEVRFGCRATSVIIEDQRAVGVFYEKTDVNGSTSIERLECDSVVYATGHSARDTYENLHSAGVQLEAKGFAVGFRIEHPQRLITEMQYGAEWGRSVVTGKTLTDIANEQHFAALRKSRQTEEQHNHERHQGKLPVPSYRLATNQAFDGERNRGVYSFCMCPGGQIVPASTDISEVCVNGMSFSKRDSQFANSALVVTVDPDDQVLDEYREQYGVLAGLAFQKEMERRAAVMGGGNLTVPVQRVTDFLNEIPSTSCPPSSYRLSVKPSPCHEIYPSTINNALRDALRNHFGKQMPGFVCDEGLLHGVETRTSSPLRISRDKDTLEAVGVSGLFPAGEGAGFAGGIVSAAVDGLKVSRAVLYHLGVDTSLKINQGDSVNSFY